MQMHLHPAKATEAMNVEVLANQTKTDLELSQTAGPLPRETLVVLLLPEEKVLLAGEGQLLYTKKCLVVFNGLMFIVFNGLRIKLTDMLCTLQHFMVASVPQTICL